MDAPSFASAQAHLSGGQTFGAASHGDDKGLYVEFEERAVHQPFMSEKEGRAIFKPVVFVIIHFPGDKTKRYEGICEEEHKHRFPRQWAAYQAQSTQTPDGTPISEWPPLTKSQVFEFKAMNIHTVEALADLPDSACTWLGSREIREKAKTWLETAAGHAADARLQAVITQQNATIEALQKQVQDVVQRYAERAREDDIDEAPAPRAKPSRRPAATQEN